MDDGRWTRDEGSMDDGRGQRQGIFLTPRFDIQRLCEEERKGRKAQIEEGRPPLYRQPCYAITRVMETPSIL